MRGYSLEKIISNGASWRVDYFIDQEFVGYGIFSSHDMAEDAGIDFMFGGSV